MPLRRKRVSDSPALRRWAWEPLLVLLGLIAVALAPGLIASDRPFQTSLCDDFEPPAACAPLERTISAATDAGVPGLTELGQVR